ncbi:hypothetical protein DWB77_04655 [Streptomyces hundungensis]|uniref:Uncharacterized protein n=1 Tax=Streptomyces hundungensis TaxID=1077946 RepID=A0A387HG73_9ACTN|nr:hypothetical protein DWB77_04655 [Streptomyces hundungensis]
MAARFGSGAASRKRAPRVGPRARPTPGTAAALGSLDPAGRAWLSAQFPAPLNPLHICGPRVAGRAVPRAPGRTGAGPDGAGRAVPRAPKSPCRPRTVVASRAVPRAPKSPSTPADRAWLGAQFPAPLKAPLHLRTVHGWARSSPRPWQNRRGAGRGRARGSPRSLPPSTLRTNPRSPCQARTSARTSSLTLAIVVASRASTFRRSNGSVLEARRLNHQSWAVTVRPSSSSRVRPSWPS